MGVHFYDSSPFGPAEQAGPLIPARILTQCGIRCVVFGEEALAFAHRVPTCWFTQQLLVPDHQLETSTKLICEALPYRELLRDDPGRNWREMRLFPSGPAFGPHCFNIGEETRLLERTEQSGSDSDSDEVNDIPTRIFIHKASVFHFDTEDPSRTCLNPEPPSPESASILFPTVPAYYDALIDIIHEPPTPYTSTKLNMWCRTMSTYLSLYNVSRRGVTWTSDENASRDKRELTPELLDVVEQVKFENRPWLVRHTLAVGALDFRDSYREREMLRRERCESLKIPYTAPERPRAKTFPPFSCGLETGDEGPRPRLTPYLRKSASDLR